MKKRAYIKRILLLILLLGGIILVVARRETYYEDREYYAINFDEEKYDLLDQEEKEIRQEFKAKQTDLLNIYLKFYIEDLVNLQGRVIVSVQDESGDTLATSTKALSRLTQTETAKWTKFPVACTLEKGKIYTLSIRTSGVGGDGVCTLYTSRNREFIFGDLALDGTESSKRLAATFLYHTYCTDDIAKMAALLMAAAVFAVALPNRKFRKKAGAAVLRLSGGRLSAGREKLLGRLLFLLSPFMAYYIVQTFCGYDLISFLEQLFSERGPFNLLIYILLCMVAYLLTNRAKYASCLTVLIAYVLGLVNYFVWEFRECPIVAADIASWKTAMNVADNYVYSFGFSAVWATVLLLFWLCLILTVRTYPGLHWKRRLAVLLLACTTVAGMWGIFFQSDLMKKLDISVSVWMPQRDYARTGSALSFLLTWTYYVVDKPQDYSPTEAARIAEGYVSDEAGDTADDGTAESQEQTTTGDTSENSGDTSENSGNTSENSEQTTPNVIAIMNESFSDLAVDTEIETSEDYMPFIHNLQEDTVKGNLYVSVLGGNTANTEFEFLTGNTLAFFPSRSVPYNSYLRKTTGSLTWTLKGQGYSGNLAVHPYYPDGWSRPTVYPLLGFDEFISQDDFGDRSYVREFISDESDFERLIEEYETAKEESDDPFYAFSVTMQNHGGYSGTHGLVDEELDVITPADADDQLVQYLNLVRKSDDALKELVNYFENVDEPTVIVMFGDHQPGFTDSVYDSLMGKKTEELDIEDTVKMYQVPYVIWANYDIEEETRDMSANYLSSYLLKLTGAKMTGYNKYLLDLMEDVPVISAICYIGDDGVIHANGEESAYSDRIREYQILQYNNMFDTENRISDFFFLKE